MKNFEKYRTTEERVEAYVSSRVLPSGSRNLLTDFSDWLDLEAEKDEILPCPFCGDECACGDGYVECLNDNCLYSSGNRKMGDVVAIAAHNRVALAVMEAEKKGDEE